ncbi:MAG: hypothetical protein RIM84_04930 [Alphaproteobacteria bacterium]
MRGTSEALHARNPKIHCVAVEPAESAVLSVSDGGEHRIEGIGADFVVPLWRADAVDGTETVATEAAMVTLMVDSGMKYLSTALYGRAGG